MTWRLGEVALEAYRIGEVSGESVWNPVVWPVRAIVTFGFGLFCLQVFAEMVRTFRIACGQSSFMRVQPFVARQKRRMNIQHPARPSFCERWRKDPHEPGKANKINPGRFQFVLQSGLEGAAAIIVAMIDHTGRDPQGRGLDQPPCPRFV